MPPRRKVFVRPPTAQEAVLAELRRAIMSGELPPGIKLLQEEIGERLGVSRVPVREALQILEGEGLLTRGPRKGYQVATLVASDLRDLFRLRELLETFGIRRARSEADAAAPSQLGVIVDELERAAANGDVDAFAAANRRFNFALFRAAEASRLRRLLEQLWSTAEPYSIDYFDDPRVRARVVRDARRIVRAARSGDADEIAFLLARNRSRLADDAVGRAGSPA